MVRTDGARGRAEQLIKVWGPRRALDGAERYVADARRAGQSAAGALALHEAVLGQVRLLTQLAPAGRN